MPCQFSPGPFSCQTILLSMPRDPFTTSAKLLPCMFGQGFRGILRLHQTETSYPAHNQSSFVSYQLMRSSVADFFLDISLSHYPVMTVQPVNDIRLLALSLFLSLSSFYST
ncbi:hypothetical protein SLEP1_g52804 [Rubroshorea leprosula]|uniref:Uncharacterized protein n=1 Tax=Rubroshorea leprosula TaxID=152421 RepID=A0AAV5MA44_9ROSI|nr:hypothetical protein SLEP1_g52804 [Rubroshorea leprosula]